MSDMAVWFAELDRFADVPIPEADEGQLNVFTALLDRFATLGGTEVAVPERAEPARAADFAT